MERRRVLIIEGEPGVAVTVFPKLDEEAPRPPYSGYLDHQGHLTISLPPARYEIISPGHKTESLELLDDSETLTVRLKGA